MICWSSPVICQHLQETMELVPVDIQTISLCRYQINLLNKRTDQPLTLICMK